MYDATTESSRGDAVVGGRGPFPDDVLGRLVRRVVRSGGFLEPQNHGDVLVSVSETMALGEMAAAGTLSQRELGDLLALEKSTVSRLVVGMEQRGWLTRERDPANRRFTRLQLTADGRTAASQIGQELHARHRALLSAMTSPEHEALLVGLTALARVLEQALPTGQPKKVPPPTQS